MAKQRLTAKEAAKISGKSQQPHTKTIECLVDYILKQVVGKAEQGHTSLINPLCGLRLAFNCSDEEFAFAEIEKLGYRVEWTGRDRIVMWDYRVSLE